MKENKQIIDNLDLNDKIENNHSDFHKINKV